MESQDNNSIKSSPPLHILIAEDDFTSRKILASMLKKDGHIVEEATDGAEAWERIQKEGDVPKLIILDWLMPHMAGLEVCRRIRTIKTDVPPYIIMLTIKDDKTDIISGLNAGADDYLTKPFDPGELRARIAVGRRIIEMQERMFCNIQELNKALDQIKTLKGIVPICSFCKKIRNDKGFWDQLEAYISRHTDAKFSHGICPNCIKEHYSEYFEEENDDE